MPGIQGCQMVYFKTQNPNLGKFLRVLKMENVGTFNDLLECTNKIKLFGIFYRH
jgi:hypothetical protein